jgi:hypothetical protein
MASPTMVPSNVVVRRELQRPLKADIRQFIEHVCFVPKADMAPMASAQERPLAVKPNRHARGRTSALGQ